MRYACSQCNNEAFYWEGFAKYGYGILTCSKCGKQYKVKIVDEGVIGKID